MSGSSYRRFVELLKLWPVDKTKIGGRDLGEYIQHRISKTFVQGVATSVDEEKCSAIVSSLTRLAKDTHKNKFPRTRESSALGLTKEECSGLLSNEFLALLRDREKPFFNSPFNQVRKLKVDRYDHVPEDEEKHCWDGIYAEQISDFVIPKQGGGIILDLTFGSGKHTEKILSADPNVRVIAIDRDPQCEEDAARLKTKFPRRLCFLNIKFSDTVEALYNIGVNAGTLSGAVLDAGLSHAQLTVPGRGGFFNSATEPLDFRMSGRQSQEPSAKDILNHIDEDSLYQVIKIYGQNKKARKISQAIIQARYDLQDIKTPADLNLLIKILEGFDDETPTPVEDQQQQEVLEESLHDGTTAVAGFHSSAASTIRALRILVNNEVNELDCAIKCVHRLLLPDAPFAVVTYNVLEDTIVKRHFTGVDVDASVSTIGCPQHRYAKTLGFADPRECKPWTPQFKLVPSYQMTHNFSHWKHAKLRTATKNGGVAYEQVLEGV